MKERRKRISGLYKTCPIYLSHPSQGGNARVVRVMPNTPALLGKGIAVIVRGQKAKPQDEKLTLALFRGVGA
jgi:pyrroline-5-carboxylate reductase